MVPKFGYVLLLACAACVLLFLAYVERNLRSAGPKTNLVRATYDAVRGSGNVTVVIEPSRCDAAHLAWIVTSYAGDPSARSALRRAYADEELRALGIKRVFLLGRLNDDAVSRTRVSQRALLDESRRYDDVLQGDFLDTYRNLTRKHLMGLRWAVNNCKGVRYLVKMDDDIVVDLYGVLENIRSSGIAEENSFTGYAMRNLVPIRESANKWYVTETEYSGSVYPDFVSGWLYITSPRVVRQLIDYVESSNEYFWIDDVFVTGILRQAISKKIRDISELYTTDHRYLDCCIKGRERLLRCEYLAGPNGGETELQVRFKEFAEFCHTNCSIRTKNNLVAKTCVAAYKKLDPRKGVVHIDSVKIL